MRTATTRPDLIGSTSTEGLPQGPPNKNAASNVYGGAGGPIKKDRLFFFVSRQEMNQTNGLSGYRLSDAVLEPIPLGHRGTCLTPSASFATASFFAEMYVLEVNGSSLHDQEAQI